MIDELKRVKALDVARVLADLTVVVRRGATTTGVSMNPDLMLNIAEREYPETVAGLPWLGWQQLGLADAALCLFRNQVSESGITTSIAAANGEFTDTHSSDLYRRLLAIHKPTGQASFMPVIEGMYWPSQVIHMTARSFVYELAVFRNLMKRLAEDVPASRFEYAAGRLERFDSALPNLVAIRDSLAHIDERFMGMNRKKPISPQKTTVGGNDLDLGAALNGDRLGIHTKTGAYEEIAITEATFNAAVVLLVNLVTCFPMNSTAKQPPSPVP